MKHRSVLLFLCILVHVTAQADYIGLFADQAGEICDLTLVAGETRSVYILAVTPELGAEGITAAEFAIAGLPNNDDPLQGSWSIDWNTELVLGDPLDGIALAFTGPRTGDFIELGRIDFQMLDASWVGPNHQLDIVPTIGHEYLNLVDHEYIIWEVLGTDLTLNCSDPVLCECGEPGCDVDPVNLDFGFLNVGTQGSLTVRVDNTGGIPLTGEAIIDHPFFFIESGGGHYSIAPGSSHLIEVGFVSGSVGEFDCVLELGAELCSDVYCQGEGGYVCDVSPQTEWDLGAVALGDFVSSSFSVGNHEDSQQNLSGQVSLDGEYYSLSEGEGPFDLAPGETLEVSVLYDPMLPGLHECEVDLQLDECPDLHFQAEAYLESDAYLAVEHIGVYRHPTAVGCSADLIDHEYLFLHVLAVRPDPQARLSSVDFALYNLPLPGEGHQIGFDAVPNTIMIGDPRTGVQIQFMAHQEGAIVELGVITIRKGDGDWIDEDHEIIVTESLNSGDLALVETTGERREVAGSALTLDCGEAEDCPCGNFDETVGLVWPAELDFGLVDLGESADRSFRICNSGAGLAEGLVDATCERFEILSGAGEYSLAHGDTLTVVLRFTPEELGDQYCTVQTGWGDVALHGTSDLPPICVVEPTELDFGTQILGSNEYRIFTIRNEGWGLLEGYISTFNPHFNITYNGGAFSLAHHESRNVTVRYIPQEPGVHVAEVTLGCEYCSEGVALRGLCLPVGGMQDHIGLFADPEATVCLLDIPLDIEQTIYIMAYVPYLGEGGITAAEFRIDNLPDNTGYPQGQISFEWNTDLVIGDPETGEFALAFSEPMTGDVIELGRLSIQQFAEDWIGDDHLMAITETVELGMLVLVDEYYNIWTVPGGGITLNCGDPGDCLCLQDIIPLCLLEPEALDFDLVEVGETAVEDFSIINTGGGLLYGFVEIAGEGFNLVSGGGDFELAAGETHTGQVGFSPTALHGYHGTLFTGLDECPGISLDGYGFYSGVTLDEVFIGIFADEEATYCYTDLGIYTSHTLHVIAYLQDELPSITAAEFRIDNWPGDPGYPVGQTWIDWATPLVLGNIEDGIALAFEEPLPGPLAYLGSIDIIAFDDNWIADDHVMTVAPSNDSGLLQLVDAEYNTYQVWGGHFTLNCSDPYYCACLGDNTPVLLSSFELEPGAGAVRAAWRAEVTGEVEFLLEAETDGVTWQVEWREEAPGDYVALDEGEHLDAGGEVLYRLLSREGSGDWQILHQESVVVPEALLVTRLRPGHPNPFNPRVTLPFSLAVKQHVRLVIYDVSGRRVKTLVDGKRDRGHHSVVWQGRDEGGVELSSGVYFVSLDTAEGNLRQKLVLLR